MFGGPFSKGLVIGAGRVPGARGGIDENDLVGSTPGLALS